MNFDEVMTALEQAGSEQTSKTYRRHGAKDPMFGVNCAVQIKLAKPLRAAQYRAKWIDLKHEWQCSAGWRLVAHAALENSLPQAEALALLERIERDIHTAPNGVKESMNGALIAIALVDKECEAKTLAAARRIGKVMVDHGDTSCKTPDAESYIIKCVEHRAKQASKRAEKRVAKC